MFFLIAVRIDGWLLLLDAEIFLDVIVIMVEIVVLSSVDVVIALVSIDFYDFCVDVGLDIRDRLILFGYLGIV